ncbi:MAG: DNRLRE domain-containing protein [Spirochaetales bacterium]|nr:DNRLRE domain-containing protein [Spirochaetales bacterium]
MKYLIMTALALITLNSCSVPESDNPPENLTFTNFISNGTESTYSTNVELSIHGIDDQGIVSVGISEDGFWEHEVWFSIDETIEYKAVLPYIMSSQSGLKEISIAFKDSRDQMSPILSDQITLNHYVTYNDQTKEYENYDLSLNVSSSTYTSLSSPDTNFSSSNQLNCGGYPGYDGKQRIYYYFDTSGLISEIKSAYLRFYITGQNGNVSPDSFRVHRLSEDWAEDTLTWNNAQDLDEDVYSILLGNNLQAKSNSSHIFNITELVNYWISNPQNNKGLVIESDDNYGYLYFHNETSDNMDVAAILINNN